MVSFNSISALALVLAASMTVNAALSQNAAARAFNLERRSTDALVERPPRNHYARAITLDHGKRFRQHRRKPATQEQLDIAAKQKAQDDQFHADNAAWQQTAIKSLSEGKTPQTFDEYMASHSGSSSTTKAASKNTHSNDDDDDQEDTSDEDSASKSTPTASKAAAQPTKTKAPAKQAAVKQPTTSSKSSSDSNSSSSGGLLSGLFTGDATFYNTGLGSCGWESADSDYIVAISHGLMDSMGNPSDPNHNPACGKMIRATIGSKSVDVKVVDRCGGCAWGDLDFSPSAFEQISSFDIGRDSGLKWSWIK